MKERLIKIAAFAAGFIIGWAMVNAVLGAVTLTALWNANHEDDLAGYVVCLGTVTGVYTEEKMTADTTITFERPDDRPLYCVVKAFDVSGNISLPSAEAFWIPDIIPPPPPVNRYDINGDGRVTASDVVQWAIFYMADDADPRLDVNGDGKVTGSDIVTLKMFIVNSETLMRESYESEN
jgi:hypothetical protein